MQSVMTPEAQRIALAEACECRSEMPDFLYDLNAIHKAQRLLLWNHDLNCPNALAEQYLDELAWIVARGTDQGCVPRTIHLFATPAQRAEALLKTIGKWKS